MENAIKCTSETSPQSAVYNIACIKQAKHSDAATLPESGGFTQPWEARLQIKAFHQQLWESVHFVIKEYSEINTHEGFIWSRLSEWEG